MFSTTPRTESLSRRAAKAERCATRCAAGWGVVTTMISARRHHFFGQRQGDVTGAGGHIDQQEVGLPPIGVGQELLYRLVQHRAPPDHGLVVGHAKYPMERHLTPWADVGMTTSPRMMGSWSVPSILGTENP